MSEGVNVGPGLEQFEGRKYLNLETYRRSGEGVRTPVWFVEADDVLYAETLSSTGKVKRLRREGRARLVPCDWRGNPEGEWVDGEVRIVGGEKAERANRMLERKYGLVKRLISVFYFFSKGERVILEMHPEAASR